MRAEITVNEEKLKNTGHTMDQLLFGFKRFFGKRGLDCILDDDNVFVVVSDDDNDHVKILVMLIKLIEFDWFYEMAESCYFYYDDIKEDILGQAEEIRSPERLRRYRKKQS